jgi:predicted O-methyltransferase YrrM
MTNRVVWLDHVPEAQRWEFHDARFRVDDTTYLSTMTHRSRDVSQLCIKKPPALVEATIELLERHQNANVVELGISQGGSTALLAQIARPRKLVALELSAEPIAELASFIDANNHGETVRPYYDVNQADRGRLDEILDLEFGDEPIDLVIDDASHFLEETRTSFEILFPRIRPGGTYVIEDWNWEHLRASNLRRELMRSGSTSRRMFEEHLREKLQDPTSEEYAAFVAWMHEQADSPETAKTPHIAPRPLTILVMELLLARASSGDVVSEMLVQDLWVSVVRGPGPLPRDFRVADIVNDRFGLLPRETA